MYALDIRKQALNVYSKIQSLRKTAFLLDIHFSSISRWLKQLERKPYSPRKYTKEALIIDTVKNIIQANPLVSSRTLTTKLKETFNVNLSRELVRVAIKNLGFTRKKARFISEPKDCKERLHAFLQLRKSYSDREFYSIDETSFGRNSFVSVGYALKGRKLYITKKQPRMSSISVCACASKNGWIGTMKKDGSFNKASFLEFLQTLHIPPLSVLLLDNIRFHHSKEVKDYLKSVNITPLYTPPYSPWFNPIEGCFSIVKKAFAAIQSIDEAFLSLQSKHFLSFFQKSLASEDKW
jgi:transposase